jgi:uncharacterized protein (TIGR00725 family)
MTAMTRPAQISVIGKGTPDPEAEELAHDVGERLARAGAVVVCGGLGGVMAASRGAASAGGAVIGIVPTTETAEANPYCTHVVATGVGHARNLAVVSSGDAVIAVGGEWGTLSEIAFARALGRAVVALQSWTVSGPGAMEAGPGVEVASEPQVAIDLALRAAEQAR